MDTVAASAPASSGTVPASPAPTPASATVQAPASGAGGERLAGVLTMLGCGVSNQVGAALGSLAFPVLGPAGVVAIRQYVAAIVLVAVGRPGCGPSPRGSGGPWCCWRWCSGR